MVKTGDILDLGPLRTKILIRQSAIETDGRIFDTEWEMGPKTGGTPVHTHPNAKETFEVLEGELDIFVDGAWKTLTQGKKTSVEKGAPHTLRNDSDGLTRVKMTFQPALKYDQYFQRLEKVVNNGIIESEKMDLKGILHLSMLMTTYPDEIRSVKPPYPVMRVLAFIGRLLGYQV